MVGYQEMHPPLIGSLGGQLRHWVKEMLDMINFLSWGFPQNKYDVHLWTVGEEYRTSMWLLLILLALSRVRPIIRLLMFVGDIWLCCQWGRWDMALFFAGAILAETNLICYGRVSNWQSVCKPSRLRRAFWWSNFVIGLYLLSQPNTLRANSTGYAFLIPWIPASFEKTGQVWRFWQAVGATWTVWAVSNDKDLQRVFSHPWLLEVGKRGYALYLIHGPVLHTVGYAVVPRFIDFMGRDGVWTYELGFVLAAVLVVIPTAALVAEIFYRCVDIRAGKFAKWFEGVCFV